MKVNQHKFNLNLPMKPGEGRVIEMDGNQLNGVSGLHVRAGSNGYTNVVMEFSSDCMVQMVAHLIANFDFKTEESCLQLAEIFREASRPIFQQLESEGESIEDNYYAQADLVKRILELSVANLKVD